MSTFTRSFRNRALLCLLLISLCLPLLLAAVLPAALAAEGEVVQAGVDAVPGTGRDGLEGLNDLGITRPYYAPEVAASLMPESEEMHAGVAERVPAEYLPESLQPDRDGEFRAAGEDAEAAGTGGWTPLSRSYTPSADPDISYWASPSSQLIDASGRAHYLYTRQVRTDISQPPDGPGTEFKFLNNVFYDGFYEGSWSSPFDLTEVSGYWDSDLVYYGVDSGDNLHVVYTRWNWRRAPSGVYEHANENLWYRRRSPDGAWSAPRELTGYTGNWQILGADFAMHDDRLYGAFTALRNNDTLPASFRAQVGFVEGSVDTWEPMVEISAWDFNQDPGALEPAYWPSIGVSRLCGEVSSVYNVRTRPGPLYTEKIDLYGACRDTGGLWHGPDNLTNVSNNRAWMAFGVIYRWNGNSALILGISYVIIRDATHPPRDDMYIICREGGAWQPPSNVTGVAAQHAVGAISIEFDSFANLHFTFGVDHAAWTGAAWEARGSELRYTRETAGGLSAPVSILGFQFQRFALEADMSLDGDGGSHILFSTVMYDGASLWDFNVNYSTNAPAGDPGVFSPAERIRPDTNYQIYMLAASTLPGGDFLASWFEKGFDGGGNPIHGRMFSRYRDGAAWRDTVIVSSIPGNTDILHVTGGWIGFEDVEVSPTGEQQAVFETAKYDVPTATYYDFRKYFTETLNGVWTTPELISGAGVSGDYPHIGTDGGRRYHVAYSPTDAATGKDVLYATQQRGPAPPAATYFFAEGTTRAGFEEWLCIQNPGEEQADVTITYMLETGANVNKVLSIPAHSRSTVNVNAAVGPEHDVSARVCADRLVVAERPMYFDYYGLTGGHCCMGARDTSQVWYFAEGTTRSGFAEYLTLQNPSDWAAHVDITYVLGDGTTMPGALDIGPRSRATVNVNTAVGPERDVSMVVESDRGIVAERPMYFDYYGRMGGHCEVGSTALDGRWYFAEGTTRGGFDTYICLQNPYDVDAVARLTFILGDGTTIDQPLPVPATSRQTLRVNDVVGPEQDVSTVVESDSLLLAERPMYFIYGGAWPGGHVAVGARSPKNSWYFAEGTTRTGFQEWLTLENPGDINADTTLSFMLEDGRVYEFGVEVPAHTRVTVAVPNYIEPEHDVSVSVLSDRAIVAERPMYFLYSGAWAGGHDVMGL